MAKSPDVRTARFRELVDQLADEHGRKYGWQSHVARQLGVDTSYLNKLRTRPGASVTQETADRACRELSLSPAYFLQKKQAKYEEFLTGLPADLPADGWLARGLGMASSWFERPPAPRDARQFALDVEHWAKAEISLLSELVSEAEAVRLGADAEVPRAAVDLLARVWTRYGERAAK